MGWVGMLIGSYVGGSVGHLPGSLIGAFLGHKAQDILFGKRGAANGARADWRPPPVDDLSAAYALLGASESDDEATLKRKYRELAKKSHPDALRARGLSEEAIGRATERMSRINAAWARISAARRF